jgi:2-phospho-L-lactate guanylyltransferase
VVVARVGDGAKSRLAHVLDPAQRHELAMSMLADVLAVCTSRAAPLEGVIAVLDTPEARAVARGFGAEAIADEGGDMNRAVRIGIAAVQACGAETAIVVPGDIPLLSVTDLRALVATVAETPRAVLVGASRDGQGTNASCFGLQMSSHHPSARPPSTVTCASAARLVPRPTFLSTSVFRST